MRHIFNKIEHFCKNVRPEVIMPQPYYLRGVFIKRGEMKTRILHTKIWKDEFVNTLSQKEKLIFIYLLTNDTVSLSGMYELPDKYIKNDLEVTQRELDVAKEKLNDKIIFYNGWIKIINHDKYNSYTGESIEKAKEKEMQSVPEELREGRPTPDTRVDTRVHPPNNHKSKTIIKTYNNKLIEEEDKTKLIEYLIEKGMNKEIVLQEINKFISYWTEKNHTGTKERWQMEKTFEVKKRLTTWFNNINKFGGKKNGQRLGKL